MAQYYVVITFKFEEDATETTILLDTIDDVRVTTSSTITEHPMATGDYVADHMYKNPVTMDVSGSISLAGSSQRAIGTGKLVDFQEMFERIKNTGTLCTIYKLNKQTNDIRFIKRDSMALNNIVWTEKINSLAFNFSFRQVMAVDILEYEVKTDDAFLPNVTEPKTLSFTESLLDWNEIDKAAIQALKSFDLIADDFLTFIASGTASGLVAVGVTLVVAKSIIAVCGSIPGAGWTALAVIGIGLAVVGTITAICKAVKRRKYKLKPFEYFKDSSKMAQEVRRFGEFFGEIHTQLQTLNQAIQSYSISDNSEQECMLTISSNYYIFNFTRNNTSNKYGLRVYDINESQIAELDDVTSALESFYACTDQNYLFYDENGLRVYLVKSNTTKPDDLTSYAILISSIKPSDFNNVVEDIIKKAIVA